MVKQILDLKQTGVKEIFLCSKNFSQTADLLEKKQIEKIVFEELRERKKDNLPPFTKIVEYIGDAKDLKKIEKIIPLNRWIIAEKSYTLLSRYEVKELQDYFQKEKLELKLRLDPPEFS